MTITYELGAEWLAGCERVEDWGCGMGWLRHFISPSRYLGVDGSSGPFVDCVADLVEYRSTVPGIFMRHVLEHNYQWRKILENACRSFTERMALVVFTPRAAETHEIAFVDPPGVPDIGFQLRDLTEPLDASGITWSIEDHETDTAYGAEYVLYCEKQRPWGESWPE